MPMPSHTLRFEAPDGGKAGDARTFDAETEHHARVKAAMLHAGASFQPVPPTAYRLSGPSGELIHHYPEE